jgi:hypothetical protein
LIDSKQLRIRRGDEEKRDLAVSADTAVASIDKAPIIA